MEEIKMQSQSQERCKSIVRQIADILGAVRFASTFNYKIDNCPSIVYEWKTRGTSPIWWMRELLIHVSHESPAGLKVVIQVLNFLAKPFQLFVIDYPTPNCDGTESYLKGFRQSTESLAHLVESIEQATSDNVVDFDEYQDIENKCDDAICRIIALRERARIQMEGENA